MLGRRGVVIGVTLKRGECHKAKTHIQNRLLSRLSQRRSSGHLMSLWDRSAEWKGLLQSIGGFLLLLLLLLSRLLLLLLLLSLLLLQWSAKSSISSRTTDGVMLHDIRTKALLLLELAGSLLGVMLYWSRFALKRSAKCVPRTTRGTKRT